MGAAASGTSVHCDVNLNRNIYEHTFVVEKSLIERVVSVYDHVFLNKEKSSKGLRFDDISSFFKTTGLSSAEEFSRKLFFELDSDE